MKIIFSFLKDNLTIQYRENKKAINYILDVVFNICVYALLIVALAAIITFIGFGYAPINVFENPKGALDYIWPYGIIVLTIPLALLFVIPNIINMFKKKNVAFLITSFVFLALLVLLNVFVYQLDLMSTIASWFEV